MSESNPRPTAASSFAEYLKALCDSDQHDWNVDEPSARVLHAHERSMGEVIQVRWETRCRLCHAVRLMILTEPDRELIAEVVTRVDPRSSAAHHAGRTS